MKKLILIVITLFIPVLTFGGTISPQFRSIEAGYGAYDILIAGDITLFQMDYLRYQPIVRFNPFTITLRWGIQAEYFPLTHFSKGFWIFADDKVNPFVYTGFGMPIDFGSVYIPVGFGLKIAIINNLWLNIKVYDDIYVAPVAEGFPGWDVSMTFGW